MWTYRQQSSNYPRERAGTARWVSRYLRAGRLDGVLGLGLAPVAAKAMLLLWPWQTGRLTLQLYSAPLQDMGSAVSSSPANTPGSEIRLGLVAIGRFHRRGISVRLYHIAMLEAPVSS